MATRKKTTKYKGLQKAHPKPLTRAQLTRKLASEIPDAHDRRKLSPRDKSYWKLRGKTKRRGRYKSFKTKMRQRRLKNKIKKLEAKETELEQKEAELTKKIKTRKISWRVKRRTRRKRKRIRDREKKIKDEIKELRAQEKEGGKDAMARLIQSLTFLTKTKQKKGEPLIQKIKQYTVHFLMESPQLDRHHPILYKTTMSVPTGTSAKSPMGTTPSPRQSLNRGFGTSRSYSGGAWGAPAQRGRSYGARAQRGRSYGARDPYNRGATAAALYPTIPRNENIGSPYASPLTKKNKEWVAIEKELEKKMNSIFKSGNVLHIPNPSYPNDKSKQHVFTIRSLDWRPFPFPDEYHKYKTFFKHSPFKFIIVCDEAGKKNKDDDKECKDPKSQLALKDKPKYQYGRYGVEPPPQKELIIVTAVYLKGTISTPEEEKKKKEAEKLHDDKLKKKWKAEGKSEKEIQALLKADKEKRTAVKKTMLKGWMKKLNCEYHLDKIRDILRESDILPQPALTHYELAQERLREEKAIRDKAQSAAQVTDAPTIAAAEAAPESRGPTGIPLPTPSVGAFNPTQSLARPATSTRSAPNLFARVGGKKKTRKRRKRKTRRRRRRRKTQRLSN